MRNPTPPPKKRFVSDTETINRIITLYVEKGMSAPNIAKEIHCSSLTILNILRSQNVKIRNRGTYPKKIKTSDQIQNIFEEYKQGNSLSVIATKYGVNPNTIYYHMRKHNKETRTNRKLTAGDIDYIRQKCQENPSRELIDALAKKFGITSNAIRYHVKKGR